MLSDAPMLSYQQNTDVYLLIDATYFANEICSVVFRDHVLKQTQLYGISIGDHYEGLCEDLQNIMNLGIKIGGATCNGDKSLLKSMHTTCAKFFVQRCLVHIHGICKIWLSLHPKTRAGFELWEIVS